MKTISFAFNCLFIVLLTSACQKKIELTQFDSQQWQAEKTTCKNYRILAAPVIQTQSDLFIGKNEGEVQKTLGRPDKIDLGSKHTKVLIYFINNTADSCSQHASPYANNTLRFELDPLGNVKFVTWQ